MAYRGLNPIEVSDQEFFNLGSSDLALVIRKCLMLHYNPNSTGLLEHACVEVYEYPELDLPLKDIYGPRC